MCDYLCVKAYDSDFKKAEFNDFKMYIETIVDFGDYIYMPLLFSALMVYNNFIIPLLQKKYLIIEQQAYIQETVGML